MKERVKELGLTWVRVAELAGLTYAGLRLIRDTASDLQKDSKDGIERALRWAPDSIDTILAGGDPTPLTEGGADNHPGGRQGARGAEHAAGEEDDPSRVTPEDCIVTLQVALDRGRAAGDGDLLFWQTLELLRRIHSPLWEALAEPNVTDRSA